MFELPRNFEKIAEQKSSFYFKNSIVDSIRTSSEGKSSSLGRNGIGSNEQEPLSPVNESPPKEHAEKVEPEPPVVSRKSIKTYKASLLKSSFQVNNTPIASNVNIINQINQTFIFDSTNLLSNLFRNEQVELENFSQAFYINQHERFVKQVNEEFASKRNAARNVVEQKPDYEREQEKLFQTLKPFLKTLYNESLLLMREMVKRTIDKFDSSSIRTLLFFDLLAISIKGHVQEADGHIEYLIELSDRLLDKNWNFKARYSKLRRLHLETKFSLALEGKNKFGLAEFPNRCWFGNKEQVFLELRKRRLQAYFDGYLKQASAASLIDRGMLRQFFFREILATIERDFSQKLQELERAKGFLDFPQEKLVNRINGTFEEIKGNLNVLGRNEALVFIYYQNKHKAVACQDPNRGRTSLM